MLRVDNKGFTLSTVVDKICESPGYRFQTETYQADTSLMGQKSLIFLSISS